MFYNKVNVSSTFGIFGHITAYNIDTNEIVCIEKNLYDPYKHITNSRKYTKMPPEYIMKLEIYVFNRDYNSNLDVNDYTIENYKAELHRLRCRHTSLTKNNAKPESARENISLALKGRPSKNLCSKRTEESRLKMSNSAKNRVGFNRKNTFHLISPENTIIICEGTLKKTIEELNLSLNTLKKHINNIVPQPNLGNKNYITDKRINTIGWTLIKIK